MDGATAAVEVTSVLDEHERAIEIAGHRRVVKRPARKGAEVRLRGGEGTGEEGEESRRGEAERRRKAGRQGGGEARAEREGT